LLVTPYQLLVTLNTLSTCKKHENEKILGL
jgi:hypothetical protein